MRKLLIFAISLLLATSCDYLDIVPDERATDENTYENTKEVKNFLYSCYAYLPTNRQISNNVFWAFCGGEITHYRKELFTSFNEGEYGPSRIIMTNDCWSPIWQGVRQCYLFLSILDKAKGMVPQDVEQYRAEANFLIAYYHFISLRTYGPTLIIDRLFSEDTPYQDFPERSSYDEVVAFIDRKLDEAIPGLAEEHISTDYGRATKYAALALRSRMYLYAASPLFNGNKEMYNDFRSPIDGRPLISLEYDINKWKKCADVTLDAITKMESRGFKLYSDEEAGEPSATKPGLPNKAQRRLRYCVMDYENNKEVIWTDTRQETYYDTQNRSMIRQNKEYLVDAAGCIAPTLKMVEKFYTKNGLPMNMDKTFDYSGRYSIVPLPANYDGNNYSKVSTGNSLKQFLDREPRFYAWIGFHNGWVEINRYNGEATGNGDNAKKAVVLHMLNNQEHGRQNRDINYSTSGFNNKKLCHPAFQNGHVNYPFCLFRLAELYLTYAEAMVEMGDLTTAKKYVDKVRTRAGIPSVDEAWNKYSTSPGYQNTQEGMREIVRRERLLEFYLEGLMFFDIRRWKEAEEWLGVPDTGLNTLGNTEEEFAQPMELPFKRTFHKGQYLMPIDNTEINKVPQIIQNPYYK